MTTVLRRILGLGFASFLLRVTTGSAANYDAGAPALRSPQGEAGCPHRPKSAFLSGRFMKLTNMQRFLLTLLCCCVGVESVIFAADNLDNNLVQNGRFESLDDWTVSNPALVSIAEKMTEGRNCLELRSDPAAKDGSPSTFVSQQFNIKLFSPDGEYRLRLMVRADTSVGEYRVSLRQPAYKDIIKKTWRQGLVNWTTVTEEFRDVNPLASSVVLEIQTKAPVTLWIDDVSLIQLPPGTIGKEEKSLQDLPHYQGSPDHVQITPDRRFLVRGKPFFPIGSMGHDFAREDRMAAMRDAGYNCVGSGHLVARRAEGAKAYLDLAHSYGLMVMGVLRIEPTKYMAGDTAVLLPKIEAQKPGFGRIVDAVRTHPALFIYDTGDEQVLGGGNLSAIANVAHWLRENDPNHPQYNLQAPRDSVETLRRWYRFADIGGSNIYPWWGSRDIPDRHSDLPNKTLSVVGDETVKNLQAMGPGKPVIQILQSFGWSDEGRNNDPQAINNG